MFDLYMYVYMYICISLCVCIYVHSHKMYVRIQKYRITSWTYCSAPLPLSLFVKSVRAKQKRATTEQDGEDICSHPLFESTCDEASWVNGHAMESLSQFTFRFRPQHQFWQGGRDGCEHPQAAPDVMQPNIRCKLNGCVDMLPNPLP